ncbi:helix-turn-helix domain-containing protein [Rhizobium puerariae]|uniref:Helix-turn-helix domain-containing protein n=1 Tax=Rhizobium puerariae TaxID=1585791 RepID=A0ABV6AJ32_9HYPH
MAVPSFFIYGEPDKPLDIGFMHVETIMERRQIHNGHVDAHKHDRMAQITFWTSGGGTYFIEDRRLDFIAPAVSFIPSGVVHGFSVAPDASDALVASIADSALPPIRMLSALGFDGPVMVRGQAGNPAWSRLRHIMERLHEDYRQGLSTSLSALVAVVTNDIANLASTGSGAARGGNELAQAFRRLVDGHYRENWPVEHYVAALGTTPHLLAKACREAYGLSVKAFIDERRLLEAKRLLLFTVRSVEDVAYEIGFRDPAYFSRFFRARIGQPPGEWRAGQANRPA